MGTGEQDQASSNSTDEVGGTQKLCDEGFARLHVDQCLSYGEIKKIIGRDPQGVGRSVCLRAIDMALRKYGVKIVCEPTMGYKRVGAEGRAEWITSKGEQVRRMNAKRFITASHIEDREFAAMTPEQKQKLADHHARTGLQLLIDSRIEKLKKLPSAKRIALVDLSGLSAIFNGRGQPK